MAFKEIHNTCELTLWLIKFSKIIPIAVTVHSSSAHLISKGYSRGEKDTDKRLIKMMRGKESARTTKYNYSASKRHD